VFSMIPKYFSISQAIISRIRQGDLQPGMKIPSENDIIKTYQVSNTTARKTLQEIENAGWAIKIKGKGTFVRSANVERSATRILGFTRNMIEAGYRPSTKLLLSRLSKKGHQGVINGRFYHLPGPLYRIVRLRYADDIPMMYEERFISQEFCPGITQHDLEQSLYDLYEQRYQLSLTEVKQMLSASIIDDEDMMSLFDLTGPIPAIVVEGVTFFGKELILEMEKSVYRGDKYKFSVRARQNMIPT